MANELHTFLCLDVVLCGDESLKIKAKEKERKKQRTLKAER